MVTSRDELKDFISWLTASATARDDANPYDSGTQRADWQQGWDVAVTDKGTAKSTPAYREGLDAGREWLAENKQPEGAVKPLQPASAALPPEEPEEVVEGEELPEIGEALAATGPETVAEALPPRTFASRRGIRSQR